VLYRFRPVFIKVSKILAIAGHTHHCDLGLVTRSIDGDGRAPPWRTCDDATCQIRLDLKRSCDLVDSSIRVAESACHHLSRALLMETHAFASLAHIRILLIPVGLIPQSSYEAYASEIRSFETLRLGEIPADTKDGKGT